MQNYHWFLILFSSQSCRSSIFTGSSDKPEHKQWVEGKVIFTPQFTVVNYCTSGNVLYNLHILLNILVFWRKLCFAFILLATRRAGMQLYLNVGPWGFNFFCSLTLSQAKEADKVELLKCLQYKSWATAHSIHPLNKRQRSHSIPEAKGSQSPAWTLLCCPALSELYLNHQVWAVSLCEPWHKSTFSFYE